MEQNYDPSYNLAAMMADVKIVKIHKI